MENDVEITSAFKTLTDEHKKFETEQELIEYLKKDEGDNFN